MAPPTVPISVPTGPPKESAARPSSAPLRTPAAPLAAPAIVPIALPVFLPMFFLVRNGDLHLGHSAFMGNPFWMAKANGGIGEIKETERRWGLKVMAL